ncbi:hypothetical protein [Spirosoma pollinicola]|uniref:hypothetical protein n=1 Tax=Spirosoma pollinicola TaxID=2057025 RepID=UPI0012FD75C4|nr:hypothetical protein [Spirosoma pollinicola]
MKTAFQKKKARRQQKILAEYQKLIAVPGAMKTACGAIIMKKFGISKSTLDNIKKGVPA